MDPIASECHEVWFFLFCFVFRFSFFPFQHFCYDFTFFFHPILVVTHTRGHVSAPPLPPFPTTVRASQSFCVARRLQPFSVIQLLFVALLGFQSIYRVANVCYFFKVSFRRRYRACML